MKKRKNKIIISYFLFCFTFSSSYFTHAQNAKINNDDTTIVAKVIDYDSIIIRNNDFRGYQFYYGIHHYKVCLLDIQNAYKILDTIVIAYVYNWFTDIEAYKLNFNIVRGKNYLFYVHQFKPCKSDFPRIQGKCDIDFPPIFYPVSNQLINAYTSIYRIIAHSPYSR